MMPFAAYTTAETSNASAEQPSKLNKLGWWVATLPGLHWLDNAYGFQLDSPLDVATPTEIPNLNTTVAIMKCKRTAELCSTQIL